MKPILQLLAIALLTTSLTSCLFQEPVFTEGFTQADSSLAGVYVGADETGDPRGNEFAVLAPFGKDTFMLHYPVGTKGSSYFEVKPLEISGKDLWQVKLVATYEDGLPKKDAPIYNVLLVDKSAEGKISIRVLKNEGDHTASAAATKKSLSEKSPDWEKLFGESKTFVRLKDR